jgi:hypothetical protein
MSPDWWTVEGREGLRRKRKMAQIKQDRQSLLSRQPTHGAIELETALWRPLMENFHDEESF